MTFTLQDRINALPQGSPQRRAFEEQLSLRETPAKFQALFLAQIDADVDQIYSKVIGNRGLEYTRAETEAKAYAAAGYTGAVPISVSSWAAAKNWTSQQAADDILAQAAAWLSLQSALRTQRLQFKENIRASTTYESAQQTMAQWQAFVSALPV